MDCFRIYRIKVDVNEMSYRRNRICGSSRGGGEVGAEVKVLRSLKFADLNLFYQLYEYYSLLDLVKQLCFSFQI